MAENKCVIRVCQDEEYVFMGSRKQGRRGGGGGGMAGNALLDLGDNKSS